MDLLEENRKKNASAGTRKLHAVDEENYPLRHNKVSPPHLALYQWGRRCVSGRREDAVEDELPLPHIIATTVGKVANAAAQTASPSGSRANLHRKGVLLRWLRLGGEGKFFSHIQWNKCIKLVRAE